jgi:predicted nucleic-acid-binding Zn-ribbon protein
MRSFARRTIGGNTLASGGLGNSTAPVASFSPPDIPGLATWVLADDLAGNDGDAVASWLSKEGNAYAFAQADGNKQPLLKTGANGIGGHKALLFDGVDDLLVLPNAPLASTKGTIIIVHKCTDYTATYQHLLSSCDEATTNYTFRIMSKGDHQNLSLTYNNFASTASMYGDVNVANNVPYIGLWQSNGDAYTMRLNGQAQAITLTGGSNNGNWFGDVPNRDNMVIGGMKRTTESAFYKGLIAEILIYDVDLDAAQTAQVLQYLSSKYQIPASSDGSMYYASTFGAVAEDSFECAPALQYAINYVNGKGSGTIYLPPGTYKVSTDLTWRSNVNLTGAGIGQSILKLYQTAKIKYGGAVATPLSDCTFTDLEVDGTQQVGPFNVQTKGFFFLYCLRCHWTRVSVHDTGATGFGSDFLVDCTFTGCVAERCGRLAEVGSLGSSGFGIGTGKYAIENTTLTNCIARDNKRYGLFFEIQGTGAGYYFSTGIQVTGGSFTGNQWGIGDCGVDGMVVDGATINTNIAEGLYVGGPSSQSQVGINGVIQNCEMAYNGAAGIKPATGGAGYTLTNNSIHDNGDPSADNGQT